jgi:hypothetical protein
MSTLRKVNFLFILFVALLFPFALRAEKIPFSIPFQSIGYEQIKYSAGVSAYKHKKSENIMLGAEGRIAASPEKVMHALLDYPHQVGVIARLSESRVLQQGANWIRVYQRLNLPVISDRDFILQVSWGQEPKREVRWIAYRAISDPKIPPRDGIVRVNYHEGSWQLKPLDGGRATWLRFQVTIDLAGWLPKWMAKSSAGKELPALFGEVCQLLNNQREGVACVH